MTPDAARSAPLAVLLAALGLLLALPRTGLTLQLTGKSDLPSLERISNPRPAPGDIALPMPGGLTMTLRPVCVPAAGYLDDVQQPFGITAQTDAPATPDAAWAERRYTASVNAPFELADIPASWGNTLPEWLQADPASAASAQNGLRAFLYFIGKYEVTRGQWRAVMAQDAPFAVQAGDDRPVTDISWFEAQDFSRRYSEWLMKNHPEFLPFFAQEKRSSYVRLPTEAEWEYAARGGHRVSPAERERTRLYPVPQGTAMGEYIIAAQYDPTLTGLAPIGSRKPNPLVLYDMLGNSAEMVQTPFHLVAAGRLMGNQGGFVIKGGSWRAFSENSLHPGRRIEASYYKDGRAQRRDDLGFRISLGTILTPRDRLAALRAEWEKRRAPHAAQATQRQDVRVIIREVYREVENPALRRRLAEAEQVAALYHEQVNANEERMMHEMLLGATFSLETIANYAARCYQLIKLMDAYESLSPHKKQAQAAEMNNMRQQVTGFVFGIQGALFYYKNMLAASGGMNLPRLLQQLEALRIQFAHEDGFSKNMGRRLTVLQKHIHAGQDDSLQRSDRQTLQDILPAWLLDRLLPYLNT